MEKEIDKPLYLCNVKNPVDHCRTHCLHGMKPHEPSECTKLELCDIVGEKVKCIKLGKRHLKKLGLYKED